MSAFWRLLRLYRPYWGWLVLSFVLALVTLLANVTLMAVSGWFIAAMAVAGVAGVSLDYFTPAAIIRACAILRTSGRYAERLLSHEATFRMLAGLRVWVYRRIEPQPPALLDTYHSGDLASRLRSDVDRLETVYLRVLNPLAVAVVAEVILLAVLNRYSTLLAVIEGVCLIAAGLVVPLVVGRMADGSSRARVHLATALTEAAVDTVQGMGELLAFGRGGDRHRARLLALGGQLVAAQVRLSRLAGLSLAATLLAANLALWGVVVMTIPLMRAGQLDGADMVMLTMLSLAAFEAVAPLPAAMQALGGVLASASRLFALADTPQIGRPEALRTEMPERFDLHLSGVSFRHAGSDVAVFDGFDLDVPQSSRIAVVGPTGSGKSTLVGLVTGLLSVKAGNITLGGHPLETFDPETLRRCFAVASQNAALFTGTIAGNLRLAHPDADEAALWRVLSVAQLDDFVRSLPLGLDTFIGEASLTLSGGQARRLSIARALLKDAAILVLDEPGEGVDYRTERALVESIVTALGQRTLLLITHRTAGLAQVDRVVRLGVA